MSYQFHQRVTIRNCVFIYRCLPLSLKSSKYLGEAKYREGSSLLWIPLARRMKPAYRRAEWYRNTAHLNWNYRHTAWKKLNTAIPQIPMSLSTYKYLSIPYRRLSGTRSRSPLSESGKKKIIWHPCRVTFFFYEFEGTQRTVGLNLNKIKELSQS